MEICVFLANKPFYFTNHLSPRLYSLANTASTIMLNQPNMQVIKQAVHDLQHSDAQAAIVLSNQPDWYWQQFRQLFTHVVAAGGVVSNALGQILFIYRRGCWDLPKGKLDPGETLEACAIREVQEETGLQHLSITAPLGSTWHVYTEKGQLILKESVWFKMTSHQANDLMPQTEEDIVEARWVGADELPTILAGAYPSIREVMARVSTTH
jgi:8-oxo-dGTP pyrophosphatase MutT (NUDIX family)